jgi:hypothetical protein
MGMGEPVRLRQRRILSHYCLIEISEAGQRGRRDSEQRRKRIISKHLRVEGSVSRIK